MDKDKAKEYQEVAALLALDIDTLYDVSRDEKLTADELRWHIALIHEMKESAINDAKGRQERYEACNLLFSLAAGGHIRSTPLEGPKDGQIP
jgi:hypothetical protein